MEAVGGLASPKNALIVRVVSYKTHFLPPELDGLLSEGVETSLADTVSTASQLEEADTPLSRAKADSPKIKCTTN